MLIFWIFVIGALVGYLFGYFIKPNLDLRKAIKEAKDKRMLALQEQNKGVYKTIVTDQNQSSELVVEVKELAVTSAGQVKVEYVSAFYKNPEFRTKKGEALLREVRELLGEYLPQHEIEWYQNKDRHENIRQNIKTLDNLHKTHFGN